MSAILPANIFLHTLQPDNLSRQPFGIFIGDKEKNEVNY